MEIGHQAPPGSVIAFTTDRPPRRSRADALCKSSNNGANTRAADGFADCARESNNLPIATAAAANAGWSTAADNPASSSATASSTSPGPGSPSIGAIS
jgi:hypothetical protein